MSRVIPVDVVLGMIDQAEQRFVMESARKRPENDHAAHYVHGVVSGMDLIRKELIGKIKDEDEKRDKPSGSEPGRAYR